MNHKTKDRLLTLGALGLICLGGFSTSGCAVQRSVTEPLAARTQSQSSSQCTTDLDCELREAFYAERIEAHWGWKRVAGIALSVVVTGFIIERALDDDGKPAFVSPPDKRTTCQWCGK